VAPQHLIASGPASTRPPHSALPQVGPVRRRIRIHEEEIDLRPGIGTLLAELLLLLAQNSRHPVDSEKSACLHIGIFRQIKLPKFLQFIGASSVARDGLNLEDLEI